MPRLYNLSSHKTIRQTLRRSPTAAERRLWEYLKKDGFHGYRFRRQFGVGRYILDFYCPKLRFAVELDGIIHQTKEVAANDIEREMFLTSCYIFVIRFTNEDVLLHIETVLKTLEEFLLPPVPLLNSEGGTGEAEGKVSTPAISSLSQCAR